MAIKRFFLGDDTKARTKKIDAAEKEAVKGKPAPVVKKPAKKPPR